MNTTAQAICGSFIGRHWPRVSLDGVYRSTFLVLGFLALALPARAGSKGGDVDLSFDPAIAGSVGALAVQADNKVLIGGAFTSVDGTPRTNIARLHPNGTLD